MEAKPTLPQAEESLRLLQNLRARNPLPPPVGLRAPATVVGTAAIAPATIAAAAVSPAVSPPAVVPPAIPAVAGSPTPGIRPAIAAPIVSQLARPAGPATVPPARAAQAAPPVVAAASPTAVTSTRSAASSRPASPASSQSTASLVRGGESPASSSDSLLEPLRSEPVNRTPLPDYATVPPMSLRDRFLSVNWDRKPAEQVVAAVEPASRSIREVFLSVNWDRVQERPGRTSRTPAPPQESVQGFFAQVDW